MLMLVIILIIIVMVALLAAWRWRRAELDTARARLADFLVRLRNHVLGGLGALIYLMPELAALLRELRLDPDFAALVPSWWLHTIGVALILLGALARLRPAARANDPEVQVKRAAQDAAELTGAPVPVLVDAGGTQVEVATVRPRGQG